MNELLISPGESLLREISVWSDEAETVPANLTNATADFKVYDSPSSTTALITGSVTWLSRTAAPQIRIALAASQTALPFSVLYAQTVLTETTNAVTVVDEMKLTIGVL